MSFSDFAFSDKPEERKKREKKAAGAECTPISIDRDNQCGMFAGSSGRYRTWLSECECVDFRRRNYPCKHMYRLASELGLYEIGAVASDTSKLKIPKQERAAAYDVCVSLVDSYSDEVQEAVWHVLAQRYIDLPCVCYDLAVLNQPFSDGLLSLDGDLSLIVSSNTQKRTVDALLSSGFEFPADVRPTKKARYEWCLAHAGTVCPIAYPGAGVVRPAGILETSFRKMYTHLNQKFREDDGGDSDWWFRISGGSNE